VVTEATANWLRDYVRQGGTLIVEYPFACRDERLWVSPERPIHGLADLLGCAEADRVVTGGDYEDVATFPGDIRVRASNWRMDLAPTSGETLASWQDGKSAAVGNRFGEGTVITLGINLSLSFGNESWDDPAHAALSWIIQRAGLEPHPWAHPAVWVRRRTGDGYEIWVVTNVSIESQTISLPASPQEVWVGTECNIESSNRLTLGGGAVWVARMPTV
jgi:beta-galactosidase